MVAADTSALLADGDHVVQFFDDAEHLAGPVSGYLTASVLEGEAVIVLAVPTHCDLFRDALVTSGVDVQISEGEGRLLMLDAIQAVREIVTDGCVDVRAFDELVAKPVRQAAGDHPVRVYGELVSVLWQAGNVAAAIELESLWNQLSAEVPFALFCSYPSATDSGTAEAFAAVCGLHSEVRGRVPAGRGTGATESFDGTPHAVSLARSFAIDTLQKWDRHELIDDVVVVVSELAANAVVHARSNFTVELSTPNGCIRVAVGDLNVDPPQLRDPGDSFVSGRGLYLVDAIAHRWGHGMVAGGKVVWAEIRPREVAVVGG